MIGGNTDLVLKTKSAGENSIGEKESSWLDYKTIHGFLDYMSGEAGRTNYNSKIEESSHVFVCDYVDIDKTEAELRAFHNNKEFDVTLIDDPMGLHKHLEIFLKYIGD